TCRKSSVDDRLRNIDKAKVVAAGMATQPGEGLLHVKVGALGQNPLGLLDDDAGVESFAELVVQHFGLERGAVLQNSDGADVGEGLGGGDVAFREATLLG